MSYEIYLKETTPGYLNLELTRDDKVVTFCDTTISKDFLYQFGNEYVELVCKNTIEQMKQEDSIKPNQLYNLFAISFIFNQEDFHSQFQKFYYEITTLNRTETADISSSLILPRIAGVFFNSCQFRNREGFLNAGSKLLSLQEDYKNLGEKIVLDGLYFKYIEAVDKWKTKETKELQHIKQFQNERQMSDFYTRIFDTKFKEFLERKNIDTLMVIPNNQVRQINFNAVIEERLKKEFSKQYCFGEIDLNAYEGREAQKSTQGLAHRIENAKKLFTIKPTNLHNAKNILLIDDVFGSGATMNTVAENIKKINPEVNIIGFTLIGSYRKGFDVVNEV